jgi:hypothetical protein
MSAAHRLNLMANLDGGTGNVTAVATVALANGQTLDAAESVGNCSERTVVLSFRSACPIG